MKMLSLKGVGRSFKTGKFDVSEFQNKNLTKVIGSIHDSLDVDAKANIMAVSNTFKSDVGQIAVKNFSAVFRKLYRTELKENCRVEYVVPLWPYTGWTKITEDGKVLRAGIIVEVGVGTTDPSADVKRYKNYFLPVAVIVDIDPKTMDVKEVTIATNTPGAYFQRAEPGKANPFLEGLYFLSKPAVESVIKLYTTGVVDKPAYNYYKPGEKYTSPMEALAGGYPLNGAYVYGSSKGFEFAVVRLTGDEDIKPKRDGVVSFTARIRKTASTGNDVKYVKIDGIKPESISVAFPRIDTATTRNTVIPAVYVINGSKNGQKVAVSFTLEGFDDIIYNVPAVVGTAVLLGATERMTLSPSAVRRVKDFAGTLDYVHEGTVRIVKDAEIRFDRSNARMNPAKINETGDGAFYLPVYLKYSVRDRKVTSALGLLVVTNWMKYTVAPLVRYSFTAVSNDKRPAPVKDDSVTGKLLRKVEELGFYEVYPDEETPKKWAEVVVDGNGKMIAGESLLKGAYYVKVGNAVYKRYDLYGGFDRLRDELMKAVWDDVKAVVINIFAMNHGYYVAERLIEELEKKGGKVLKKDSKFVKNTDGAGGDYAYGWVVKVPKKVLKGDVKIGRFENAIANSIFGTAGNDYARIKVLYVIV